MERILIIDDDRAIRYLISVYLVKAGYEVKEARDGVEGIEFMKKDPGFKAVITDIRMPVKDGNDVARYVKHSLKREDIPVVAITGFVDDADRELFDVVLEKPFKIEELIERIRQLS